MRKLGNIKEKTQLNERIDKGLEGQLSSFIDFAQKEMKKNGIDKSKYADVIGDFMNSFMDPWFDGFADWLDETQR